MNLIFSSLYLLLLVALGYLIISLIRREALTLVQLLGVVPVLGAGMMGWLLFWMSLAGFAPSRGVMGLIGGATLAGILTLAKFRRLAPIQSPLLPRGIGGGNIIAWLVIVAVLLVLGIARLTVPLVDWDSMAIWGFKAKVLFYGPLRPAPDYFHDLTLSFSHLDYPLMLPFLTAGAYAAMGAVDEQTGKLVSVFLDVLIVPLIFWGLRWKLSRLPASLLCVMLVLLPVFLLHSGDGCADMPLATFYAGGIIFLARWVELQKGEDLILAVLFNSFILFTKNEGLVLSLISGLVLLLMAARKMQTLAWKGAAWFCFGSLAFAMPWLIWNHQLPHTHENYGPKLMSTYLLSCLPNFQHIIWEMFLRTTVLSSWGCLWIVAVVMAVLGRRSLFRPAVQTLWILLCLHLLAYALVYCVTPWNLDLLLATSLDRLLWHTVPAVILLAGWHWAGLEAPCESSSKRG